MVMMVTKVAHTIPYVLLVRVS